jgi:hypothetical protein
MPSLCGTILKVPNPFVLKELSFSLPLFPFRYEVLPDLEIDVDVSPYPRLKSAKDKML